MREVKPFYFLVLSILIMVLFHLFGYSGHFGFDDMHYAYLANELKNGNFYLQDHFSYRLGTLLFTWLTYCLFGINDFASSLPSMTYSAICLYLVYQMLKKQSNLILCFGLLLTISSEWFLFYSDKLMPDFAVTFAFVGAFYAVYRQYFVNSNLKPVTCLKWKIRRILHSMIKMGF